MKVQNNYHKEPVECVEKGHYGYICDDDGIDHYGDGDYSCIHAKFGRLQKHYNFSASFAKAHPDVVALYQDLWEERDQTKSVAKSLHFAELASKSEWGKDIIPYYNFIDREAMDWAQVVDYIKAENDL